MGSRAGLQTGKEKNPCPCQELNSDSATEKEGLQAHFIKPAFLCRFFVKNIYHFIINICYFYIIILYQFV